jgi:hypothetical protein
MPVRNLGDDRNVAGMHSLAKMLRCSAQTVKRWTQRPFDPLRLRTHPARIDNYPIQRMERVTAWRIRTWGSDEQKAALDVVYGWEAIAERCDAADRIVRDLAARKVDPLPVQPKRRRNPLTGAHEVWAYADALRDWLDAHTVIYVAGGGPTRREDVCPPLPQKKRGKRCDTPKVSAKRLKRRAA